MTITKANALGTDLALALSLIKANITADQTQRNADLHNAVGLIVRVARDAGLPLQVQKHLCAECGIDQVEMPGYVCEDCFMDGAVEAWPWADDEISIAE